MCEENSRTSSGSNLLETAASSYLRSARHQPVKWHPWGEAAFARAQAEDKPILLDIGAVWCHWCHVMDRESYEDPEVAKLINEHFVAVKVDRDERPDVDARYQAAVSAISGQGGWPLTAFLTPDGRPYFGGTYIPREERYGRPGIGRVLLAMSQVWRERRDEALETAGSVMAAIEHNESFSGGGGELTLALVDKIAGSVLGKFDPRYGGFGSQPKFPHPASLDLLLEVAMNRDNDLARDAFITTLEKMARGGVYDQLAGGFHRYSVDERWVVPHFEKMLYDNTELLRNYVHGFQSFVREDFLETALEIVGWLDSTMTDRERGGFYASQDADVGLDDDGDYFTWTVDEAKAVLDPEEFEFAASYWDIGEIGDMHHNPAKNVLHVKKTLEEMAAEGGDLEQMRSLRDRARKKLLAARNERKTPFIDKTLVHGMECDGGDGVSRDGAGVADGGAAAVCVAHAGPAVERGVERGRCAEPRDCVSGRGGRRAAGGEGAGDAGRLCVYGACVHRCMVCKREHEFLPGGDEDGRRDDCAFLRCDGLCILMMRRIAMDRFRWGRWGRGGSRCRIHQRRQGIRRLLRLCCGWRR